MTDNAVSVYVAELRSALTGMTLAEREEIVEEIRAHIRDRVSGSGLSTLEVLELLGSPRELARGYSSGALLQRASRSFSPWLILRAAFRWSLAGVQGFSVFIAALVGYTLGTGLMVCAALKPLFPDDVGMWIGPGMFNLGFHPGGAPAGREVLGEWFIPFATLAGVIALIVTTVVIRTLLPMLKGMRDTVGALEERTPAV
jgi:hypothetical protein